MKKRIALAVVLILLLGVFAGCSDTESPSTPLDEPMINFNETITPAAAPAAPAAGSPLLSGYVWPDGVILIDGVLYRCNALYNTQFSDNGWHSSEDDAVLDAHSIEVMHIKNEDYDAKIQIIVKNDSDYPRPLKYCTVTQIEVDCAHGSEPYELKGETCYDFELPGGIRRGAAVDEIKAAYGDQYVLKEEDTYCTMTYQTATISLELRVYAEYGLQEAEIDMD